MRWDTLRSIGNSKAVQLSILFPVVGYLILFNDEVARFLSMKSISTTYDQGFLEQLWKSKLYFVYFGLMAMGIGSAFYQMFCPAIVKKHFDYLDYIRVDGDSWTIDDAIKVNDAMRFNVFLGNSDTFIMQIMRKTFERAAHLAPAARYFVSIMFVVGLILLAIPSALSAIKVLGRAFA